MPTDEATETGAVVCEVEIAARPETVFPFFTDPELMVRWMGSEATLAPHPGGVCRIRVHGDNIANGEYVEVEPPSRVVFTWGWESEDTLVPPGSSTIEVVLAPRGDGTLVTLSHSDLPEESRGAHGMGWSHYLARLAIAGAGGDAGPDLGPDMPD